MAESPSGTGGGDASLGGAQIMKARRGGAGGSAWHGERQWSGADMAAIEGKARRAMLEIVKEDYSKVAKLSREYYDKPSEPLRLELNRENRHLHGEVHVLSNYMDKDGKRLLFELESDANQMIIEAAEKNKREIEYVNISKIKASNGQSASKHIHGALNKAEDEEEFVKLVEKEVLASLKELGYQEREFLRRLLEIKTLSRERVKDEVRSAAQIAGETPEEVESLVEANVRVAQATDKGLKRSWNEDAILARQFHLKVDGKEVTRTVLAVADGMGGQIAGDIASDMAIKSVDSGLKGLLSSARVLQSRELNRELQAAYKNAMSALESHSKEKFNGEPIGTTLTAVVIDRGLAHIAHIGDSKAYLIRDGKIEQVTIDHDDKEHGKSHALTKGLMTGAPDTDTKPDIFDPIALKKGDMLVVCSDGLENCKVSDEEIGSALIRNRNSLHKGCSELIELANSNGGKDNISIIAALVE